MQQLLIIEMTQHTGLTTIQLMVENKDQKGMPIRYPEFAKRVQKAMEDADVSVTDIKNGLKISYEMARRYTLGHALPRSEKMNMLGNLLKTDPAQLQYGNAAPLDVPKIDTQRNTWPFSVSYELFAALPKSEKKQVGDYVEFVVNKWHSSPDVKRRKA